MLSAGLISAYSFFVLKTDYDRKHIKSLHNINKLKHFSIEGIVQPIQGKKIWKEEIRH